MFDGTPLQFACWGGNLELVQYLAEELQCNVGESLAITTSDRIMTMTTPRHSGVYTFVCQSTTHIAYFHRLSVLQNMQHCSAYCANAYTKIY